MQSYIVVGAGILGASTAYHLVKAGAKVTIVDRQDLGQATDAAAGIICPWLTQRRNKAWYELAKGGARYYPLLIKELEDDGETNTGYAQVGALSLHTDEQKLDSMEERAYKRREDAPEMGLISRLSPSETKRLFPPLAEQYGSIHLSGGARVNGRALRQALLNASIRHGAETLYGDAALHYHGNQVTGIKMDGKTIEADHVIVTGGAWSSKILLPLGYEFLVTPQKAQIVHLELPFEATESWPVVMPPNNQYILAFEAGRIVVGATHEDQVGFDYRVTAGGVHEILNKALEVAPGLKESTILETRVGFRPFTPGFLPVVGCFPEIEGLFLANGLGASGLTVGPYLGAQLAKLAQGSQIEIKLDEYALTGAIAHTTETF